MLTTPRELIAAFPVRKTAEQWRIFLDGVQAYGEFLGYPVCRETGWLLLGDSKTADYLLSADNSDGALLTLLEILRSLPENRRHRVCILMFENARMGPYSYCKSHPKALEQLMLRLGDIGCGDVIRMFPTRKLNEDRKKLTSLYSACGYFGKKNLLVQEKSFLPKWIPFPYAVHVCSIVPGRKAYYRNRLKKSTSVDETNINILRAALVSFICCEQPK